MGVEGEDLKLQGMNSLGFIQNEQMTLFSIISLLQIEGQVDQVLNN